MFGIDVSPSSAETGQYNALSSASQFATGLGEGNLTLSSEFFQNLLTNPIKALAPEISAGQLQTQQQAKTNAEFGTRSGGTAGANQAASAQNRANVINLMGGAQTGAASTLGSTGANLLGTGIAGTGEAFGEASQLQQQRANMWNDLFKGISSVGGAAVGGLPGSPGGAQDVISNMLGEMG